MKKTLLIAAAFAFGSAAIAQDQPAAPPANTNAPAPTTPAGPESAPNTPAPSGSDPATTQPSQPSDVTSPSPGAANPNSGAAPGGAPADPSAGGMSSGGMSSGNMGQAQQTASATDTSSYPKCSRTVTDKCVSAGGSGRRMMRRHR